MCTSFWDDDEDKVQIIYQDDQLPPLDLALQEHVARPGTRAVLKVALLSEYIGNDTLLMQDENSTCVRGSLKLN